MKFPYLKQPHISKQKSWISRPLIPVRLFYKNKHIDVYALIDSGADSSIFHSSIADLLGVNLRDGRKESFFGISGSNYGIDVYFHKIKLQIIGSSDTVEIEVGFAYSPGVAAILGQNGFFDNFHVKFERDKERVEILPVRKN
ncbi:MAG: hypothetical protein AAB584_00245 [Patescibacteria group bacterium]